MLNYGDTSEVPGNPLYTDPLVSKAFSLTVDEKNLNYEYLERTV